MVTTQKMLKLQAAGALLQEGQMTRSQIAKKIGLNSKELLVIERVQDKNRKNRAAWNWGKGKGK